VLFDTFASSVFCGRSAATVAEIVFAYQVSVYLNLPVLFAMGTIAQLFCWYSVLSLSPLGHVIEESIWGSMGIVVLYETRSVLALLFVLFMFGFDVPMYFRRWRSSSHYLSLFDGAVDALKRRIPRQTWPFWKEEVYWLTGYALCCVSVTFS
jgi:hypothetical protein